MKEQINILIKYYLHDALICKRTSMGLTQEEMAQLLLISPRAYASLESLKSTCSIVTFLLFLLLCGPERDDFLNGLLSVLEKIIHPDDSAA